MQSQSGEYEKAIKHMDRSSHVVLYSLCLLTAGHTVSGRGLLCSHQPWATSTGCSSATKVGISLKPSTVVDSYD